MLKSKSIRLKCEHVKVVSELVERTLMDNRSSPFSCRDGRITKRLSRVSTNELIYSTMISMSV